MYEQHFGLKKRPFRAKATGSDVFVGPHIAATMAGIKSALSANDAIVTVSGAVGSGKTTLVERALQATANDCKVVRIARMRLDSDHVLDYLLDELGTESKPKGPIQRFALFRRQLDHLQNGSTRVVIVVEDTVRLGADALAELEALTASDAGESDGANLVLMGDEGIVEFLKDRQLARLQQRLRQRLTIAPLPVAELRGYLRHCFRLAGNDFESIFEDDAAARLHYLSQGIPRVANNLVESAMAKAANSGAEHVSSQLLTTVAEDEYGISSDDYTAPQAAVAPAAIAVPAEEPEEAADDPVIEESEVPEPLAEAPAAREPVIVFAEPLPVDDAIDEEIPELIQDTLPDLEILAPALAAAALETETRVEEHGADDDSLADEDAMAALSLPPVPELNEVAQIHEVPEVAISVESQEIADIPELAVEPAAAIPSVPDEPDVDSEPDFESIPELPVEAELEIPPELTLAADAFAQPEVEETREPAAAAPPTTAAPLEIAPEPEEHDEVAVKEELAVADDVPVELTAEPFTAESDAAEVPAWERDPTMAELRPDIAALEQAMAFAHGEQPEGASPCADVLPPAPIATPKAPEVIPEITLDNAISQRIENHLIDERDEISAPTTGNELPAVKIQPRTAQKADAEVEKIVAELAKAKSLEDIDDRMAETLFGEEINFAAAQALANGPDAFSANDNNGGVATGQPVARGEQPSDDSDKGMEVTLEAPRHLDGGAMDLSASQRLKTVRALNADLHPSLREPEPQARQAAAPTDNATAESPHSIEDQITSMTQTLKALNVSPPMLEDDDDDRKGGFFSRFKRS